MLERAEDTARSASSSCARGPARRRQSLQPRSKAPRLTDDPALLRCALADQIADHGEPGARPLGGALNRRIDVADVEKTAPFMRNYYSECGDTRLRDLRASLCRSTAQNGAAKLRHTPSLERPRRTDFDGRQDMSVTVTFAGCGDAFGSGGRFNTCFVVDAPNLRFVIDFGATSLVALNQLGIGHNTIGAIVLTHFHGDHCGGVPFLILDAMLAARRTTPLIIIGPKDTQARLTAVADALLPGMSCMTPKFDLCYRDTGFLQPSTFGPLTVTSYPAAHTDATNPASVRIDVADKVISYTGDTAWTEHLPAVAHNADLFICESYHYTKPVRFHLNYCDIRQYRDQLRPKRMILTHFSREMLGFANQIAEECAHDGLVVTI